MSAELWITNILKILFVIVGAHLAITKVLPMFKNIADGLGDKKVSEGLVGLFAVLILVLAGLMIFDFIIAIGSTGFSYLTVIKPAFDMVFKLEYYLKYIVLGVIVVLGLKAFKKA